MKRPTFQSVELIIGSGIRHHDTVGLNVLHDNDGDPQEETMAEVLPGDNDCATRDGMRLASCWNALRTIENPEKAIPLLLTALEAAYLRACEHVDLYRPLCQDSGSSVSMAEFSRLLVIRDSYKTALTAAGYTFNPEPENK